MRTPRSRVIGLLFLGMLVPLAHCGAAPSGDAQPAAAAPPARVEPAPSAPATPAAETAPAVEVARSADAPRAPSGCDAGAPRGTSMLSGASSFVQGADPFVLKDPSGAQFLFTTNRPGVNVPAYQLRDVGTLEPLGDALPAMPKWAKRGFTWAPEVLRLSSDRYALWFSARDAKSDRQCVGRAFASRPQGPYVDDSDVAFLCEDEAAIDQSPFRDDDGQLYLLWKTKEQAARGLRTTIWIGRLDASANLVTKSMKPLLANDQSWEGEHVEAPTLIHRKDGYFLFYSAGASTDRGYLVSYATATNVDGPYRKSNDILIGGNPCMKGAGHEALVPAGDDDYLIYYHAFHPERRDVQAGKSRFLDYAHLCFRGGKPVAQDAACGKPNR
jgi:GH43 family beta-xylosidase